jgi:thioredoxin-like negative regulator of GroEL
MRLLARAAAALLAAGLVAAPAFSADRDEQGLSAYLGVAERFRGGGREEALEALARWRPRDLEAAVHALTERADILSIETERKEARDLLRRALDRDPTLAASVPSRRRSAVVVFSDGVDNASWLSEEAVEQTARRSPSVVYAVVSRPADPR